MANFDTIKTAIDANIKTNGTQDITGGKMNSILKQMVDATGGQLTELESKVGIISLENVRCSSSTTIANNLRFINGVGYEFLINASITEDGRKACIQIYDEEKVKLLETELVNGENIIVFRPTQNYLKCYIAAVPIGGAFIIENATFNSSNYSDFESAQNAQQEINLIKDNVTKQEKKISEISSSVLGEYEVSNKSVESSLLMFDNLNFKANVSYAINISSVEAENKAVYVIIKDSNDTYVLQKKLELGIQQFFFTPKSDLYGASVYVNASGGTIHVNHLSVEAESVVADKGMMYHINCSAEYQKDFNFDKLSQGEMFVLEYENTGNAAIILNVYWMDSNGVLAVKEFTKARRVRVGEKLIIRTCKRGGLDKLRLRQIQEDGYQSYTIKIFNEAYYDELYPLSVANMPVLGYGKNIISRPSEIHCHCPHIFIKDGFAYVTYSSAQYKQGEYYDFTDLNLCYFDLANQNNRKFVPIIGAVGGKELMYGGREVANPYNPVPFLHNNLLHTWFSFTSDGKTFEGFRTYDVDSWVFDNPNVKPIYYKYTYQDQIVTREANFENFAEMMQRVYNVEFNEISDYTGIEIAEIFFYNGYYWKVAAYNYLPNMANTNVPYVLMQSEDFSVWSPVAKLDIAGRSAETSVVIKDDIVYLAWRSQSEGSFFQCFNLQGDALNAKVTIGIDSKPQIFLYDNNIYIQCNVNPNKEVRYFGRTKLQLKKVNEDNSLTDLKVWESNSGYQYTHFCVYNDWMIYAVTSEDTRGTHYNGAFGPYSDIIFAEVTI